MNLKTLALIGIFATIRPILGQTQKTTEKDSLGALPKITLIEENKNTLNVSGRISSIISNSSSIRTSVLAQKSLGKDVNLGGIIQYAVPFDKERSDVLRTGLGGSYKNWFIETGLQFDPEKKGKVDDYLLGVGFRKTLWEEKFLSAPQATLLFRKFQDTEFLRFSVVKGIGSIIEIQFRLAYFPSNKEFSPSLQVRKRFNLRKKIKIPVY